MDDVRIPLNLKHIHPDRGRREMLTVLSRPSLLGLRGSRQVLADTSVRVQSEKQNPLGGVPVPGIRCGTWG